jgi:RimJ/RimL family protein N-acetyltransferase
MKMFGETLADGVLVLEPLVADDAEEWLAGEDKEQLRWFEASRPAELSDVQRFIISCQDSWRKMGDHRHWGIRKVESDSLIGGVDLRVLGDGEVNLSFVVFPQFRRQGIARRASLLALSYATRSLGSRCAVIKMLPGNVSSKNLARSLGARYTGDEPSDAGKMFEVFKLTLPTL